MDTASIFSGKMYFSTPGDIGSLQPAEIEHGATIAWQWLVLAAAMIWIGTLIAEWRLLAAASGDQRPEFNALLLITIQRRQRQCWLWLSIILLGTVILFWVRSTQVLPQAQLNELPNWTMLAQFLFSTSEGWLWLARGGLAFLAMGLSMVSAFSTWHHARAGQKLDLQASNNHPARCSEIGDPLYEMSRSGGKRTFRRSRLAQSDSSTRPIYRHTREPSSIQRRLRAERRSTQLSIALAAALLFTLALADPSVQGAQMYITALALNWVALLALAAWLGGTLYLAFVFAPATHVIESGERTQTLVELLPAIRPPIIQAFAAISLYAIFSVEAHLSNVTTPLERVSTPYGWAIIAGIGLVGLLLLLTCYQERRALPHLARMAWLAARGTLMGVLGGIDVSRALQIGQHERQALANLAERRFRRILYAQVVLGLLILLCLVLASLFAPIHTI